MCWGRVDTDSSRQYLEIIHADGDVDLAFHAFIDPVEANIGDGITFLLDDYSAVGVPYSSPFLDEPEMMGACVLYFSTALIMRGSTEMLVCNANAGPLFGSMADPSLRLSQDKGSFILSAEDPELYPSAVRFAVVTDGAAELSLRYAALYREP